MYTEIHVDILYSSKDGKQRTATRQTLNMQKNHKNAHNASNFASLLLCAS